MCRVWHTASFSEKDSQPTAAMSLTLWAVTEVTTPMVTVMGDDDAIERHNGCKQ